MTTWSALYRINRVLLAELRAHPGPVPDPAVRAGDDGPAGRVAVSGGVFDMHEPV